MRASSVNLRRVVIVHKEPFHAPPEELNVVLTLSAEIENLRASRIQTQLL
jgi:hypothetical protein